MKLQQHVLQKEIVQFLLLIQFACNQVFESAHVRNYTKFMQEGYSIFKF